MMKSSIPTSGGTFQPLRHRSGTMRSRLHGYTKRTLGAGGSVTEAVSFVLGNTDHKRSDPYSLTHIHLSPIL